MAIEDNASIALIPSGYKSGKLYSVIPDSGNGDFTHSRGSTATRLAASGLIETVPSGVPRLDYPLIDGVVQDCPALLLEPSRQNKITYSIPNSNWATQNGASITENYSVSPDGSQNASRFQIPSGSLARIYTQFTVDTNEDSVSFYIKSNTGSNFNMVIYLRDAGFGTVRYSDTNLEVTTDWQRVKIENQDLSAASVQVMVLFYNTAGTGDTWDFSLWGVQVEGGSYATSYIPNYGTALGVTRSADVCNGSGTSAEFNDSEGVLFAEMAALGTDGITKRLAISNSSNSYIVRLEFRPTVNQIYGVVFLSPSNTALLTHTVSDWTEFNKVAIKYKQNDFAMWINGVEVATDSLGSTGTGLDDFSFDGGDGGNDWYGKTKQLMTFKTALSDSDLETLTSWDSFTAMAKGQQYTIE